MFHNTIDLLPSQKATAEVRASRQNDKVLKVFKDHPRQDFTPAQVYLMFGQQYPLTSIRRAITTLTTAGDLIKNERTAQRKGLYGSPNNTWKLKTVNK
jgi:Fe2+ or Zn2+ uptake regulation protein